MEAMQEQETSTAPHEQDDGRVLLTDREHSAAVEAMSKLAQNDFVQRYMRTLGGEEQRRYIMDSGLTVLLEAAVRAVNQRRLGDPEGTICVHSATGKMARRYWSDRHQGLRWLVVDPAHDGGLDVETVEALHAIEDTPWTRVLPQDWPIMRPEESETS